MYHLNSISSIIECFAFTKTALFAKWHMQSANVKIPSKMTLRVCDVKYNVTRNRSYSENVFILENCLLFIHNCTVMMFKTLSTLKFMNPWSDLVFRTLG